MMIGLRLIKRRHVLPCLMLMLVMMMMRLDQCQAWSSCIKNIGGERLLSTSSCYVSRGGFIIRRSSRNGDMNDNAIATAAVDRRKLMSTLMKGLGLALVVGAGQAPPSAALVKGNAPPSDFRKSKTEDKSKALNIEDALERGKLREDQLFAQSEKDGGAFKTTPEGDRFRDIIVSPVNGRGLQKGDTANIRYRALRLGKRSRDGLSGEASTVFSYGFGEDDDKDGAVMEVTLGKSNLIPALESGLIGMKAGGKRRILVRPERGWFKGKGCGVLESMDMNNLAANFIVPGTKITDIEDCLDLTRIPNPTSYAAKRRMGRRFDESLIVEVEYVR